MWEVFVVLGTLLSAAIWFFQRKSWPLFIRLVLAAIAVVAFASVLYINLGPETLGEAPKWYQSSPYRECTLFILMLLGMAARYITKAIEARREKIAELQKQATPFKKPGLEFDVWEFSYPLFISVVTYGALLAQMKAEPALTVQNVTLSFQTGFFWQTLLAAKQAQEQKTN